MLIVIVEHDPIVRIDMEETLISLMESVTVSCVTTLSEVEDIAGDLLIIDTALDRQNLTAWLAQGAQILSTGPQLSTPSGGPLDGVRHLQRPFSSEMLARHVEEMLADH
ncbi:hypothetical protein [Pseudooctadecabacter sp.]|uniref:hypothetical protein n=1 Tax=Pseudooctadecabacter sp. TaxID=1966338 RepID=UPI0035C7CFD7